MARRKAKTRRKELHGLRGKDRRSIRTKHVGRGRRRTRILLGCAKGYWMPRKHVCRKRRGKSMMNALVAYKPVRTRMTRHNPDKSKGHLGFSGGYEYWRSDKGDVYKAPASSPIDVRTLRRSGRFEASKAAWDALGRRLVRFESKNPRSVVIREEPHPLQTGRSVFRLYEGDGTPLYRATETMKDALKAKAEEEHRFDIPMSRKRNPLSVSGLAAMQKAIDERNKFLACAESCGLSSGIKRKVLAEMDYQVRELAARASA